MSEKALIVVDVQNDFMPGGAYPVTGGDEVVHPINKLIDIAREGGWFLAFSRDWHLPGENHCVQGTKGAKHHKCLDIREGDLLISKGLDNSPAHYSAFNGDDFDLNNALKKYHVAEVYVVGLALDMCVLQTALSSKSLGYKTFIVEDASRGVFKKISYDRFLKILSDEGIALTHSSKLT